MMKRSDFLEGWGRAGDEPGIYFMDLASAISIWALVSYEDGPRSIADASEVFKLDPAIIIEAVRTGVHLMWLSGREGDGYEHMFIEHDGE